MLISFKMSKAGYGKPQEILDMALDIVIGIIEYESFISKYEEAFIELNKKE